MYYDDLATFFFDDHDVIPFAFDWRRPMEDEAKRLADAVDAALDARKTSKQPVRIIAHSMGGLVARTMQLVSRSDVGPDDGGRRRAPADAGHAERRLVGADAGAVGRRHVRQSPGHVGAPFRGNGARS